MKLKSFNIFKKILDDEKSNFVKNNKKKIVKSSKNTIFPVNDLVNTIDTPFVILDKNYKVNFANYAAKKQFSVDKDINIFSIFRRPEFKENIMKKKSKRQSNEFIYEFFESQGSKFFNIKTYILRNNFLLLSFMDISRLKKLENLRSDFVGNVSHELKTPLNTIINIIELIKNQKNLSLKERKKFMSIFEKETYKMKSIIEDLLDLTKIETDLEKKISNIINLNKIILSSVDILKKKANKNNIKIKIQKTKKFNILGDANQLQQMFVNILDNSIKYADKNSTVNIYLKNVNNKTVLIFKDKGPGIPNSLIPRITERFYRVPQKKIQNIEGTGLGLAIVKHIVIRHKAKINITSKVGEGSLIEIIFNKSHATRLNL
tara:strand:+ start:7437 stop:8561 length:1125 start_codon:yes stop_codon:yes gene_type:complete